MSNPETPNWDTEEMGRWIDNDGALYYTIHETPSLTAAQRKAIVTGWCCPDGFAVDLDEVDWSAVI